MISECPKCVTGLRKEGIDRKGTNPRQRYRCKNGHIIVEPREYPLGKQFQSSPEKLAHAIQLMELGSLCLGAIGEEVGLDRYTIYKLNRHLGRKFKCQCRRELGHRGVCKPRFDRSPLFQQAFIEATAQRRVNTPEWKDYRKAREALRSVVKYLERQEK